MLKKLLAVVAATLCVSAASMATVIYSENPAPGDLFTAGNSLVGDQIGSTNWYYNYVRNASVGIRNDQPYLTVKGNGSVYFDASAPSGTTQAGLSYFSNAKTAGSGFFTYNGFIAPFSQLESITYSWYRSSASNVGASRHPVLEILLDLDGNLATAETNILRYWRFYNGVNVAPTNQWETDTVSGSSVMLRGFGVPAINNVDKTLDDWKSFISANYPNAQVVAFSFLAYGTGGQTYIAAVDDISWTIGGQTTSFNFEVQPTGGGGGGGGGQGPVIPEPTTMALFALGLGSVALVRRRMA